MILQSKVGVVYNPWAPRSKELVEKFREKLGLDESSWIVEASSTDFKDPDPDMALIITIGGDGTILWANQLAAPRNIPILGVNLGRVGFLTELSADKAIDSIGYYLDGTARVEERAMLEATISGDESKKFSNERFQALNDVVVGRSAISRLVHLEVSIDDAILTTYRADAVIVATATGSTGYSISAGGPILSPESSNILINPLATHLGMDNPLVVPSDSCVEIALKSDYEAVFSLDGRPDLELLPGQVVKIIQSEYTAKFLRLSPANQFYSVLTNRLNPETTYKTSDNK
ncbi:MAG: NAD(+)/NADH kinase [SAR202 cluster bacterium]|nr:NAD(+)/NADH kinase [SAR202 cluster bacterium]|tara:strand:- start:3956 stop:4822 length:867 start_codon:yes stop_codon:yes gene_type:complete